MLSKDHSLYPKICPDIGLTKFNIFLTTNLSALQSKLVPFSELIGHQPQKKYRFLKIWLRMQVYAIKSMSRHKPIKKYLNAYNNFSDGFYITLPLVMCPPHLLDPNWSQEAVEPV